MQRRMVVLRFAACAVPVRDIVRTGEVRQLCTSSILSLAFLLASVGFAEVPDSCLFPCTDSDPGFADIDFALSLNNNGRVYILEGGSLVPGPDLSQSFGTYAAGERFRVRVRDNFNGTASVRYTRIVGACVPGNPCNESLIFERMAPVPAAYPLRAAAAFREQGATLANVSIVRIQ